MDNKQAFKIFTGTASANSAKFRGIRPRTSRIYFDNAGGNVTLTLYYVTLMSQKQCLHNNKSDCSKTNGLNEVYVFSIKYRYSDILLKKHKLHAFCYAD